MDDNILCLNGAFNEDEPGDSITGDGDSVATVTGDAETLIDLGSWTGTFVILNCIGTEKYGTELEFLGTRDCGRALVFSRGLGGDHLLKGLRGNFGKIASNMLYGACLCIAYRCSVSANGFRIP